MGDMRDTIMDTSFNTKQVYNFVFLANFNLVYDANNTHELTAMRVLSQYVHETLTNVLSSQICTGKKIVMTMNGGSFFRLIKVH